MPDLLNKFLGKSRWLALRAAFEQESSSAERAPVGAREVFVAMLLAIAPVALTVLDELRPAGSPPSNLPTLAFGICALLAALLRSRLGFSRKSLKGFRSDITLTHTAVALGCVPAVLLLAFAPTLLAERHDSLVTAIGSGSASGGRPSIFSFAIYLIAIAGWVAATEEFLFRGLLLSVLRRAKWIASSQRMRDVVAIVFSAFIFGIAHWATWGAFPALALFGLGIGFGLAYVANGEQLIPVMLYHFGFDLASMAISLFT